MSGKSITLDLPEDLYERVRQVAEQSQRSLEHVLVESIRLLFVLPPTSTDVASILAAMPSYADAQLWAMVYQRLVWPQ